MAATTNKGPLKTFPFPFSNSSHFLFSTSSSASSFGTVCAPPLNLSLCLSKHFHGHCFGIPGVYTVPYSSHPAVPSAGSRSVPPTATLPLSSTFHLSPSHWLRFISLGTPGVWKGPLIRPRGSQLCPVLVTHRRPAHCGPSFLRAFTPEVRPLVHYQSMLAEKKHIKKKQSKLFQESTAVHNLTPSDVFPQQFVRINTQRYSGQKFVQAFFLLWVERREVRSGLMKQDAILPTSRKKAGISRKRQVEFLRRRRRVQTQ